MAKRKGHAGWFKRCVARVGRSGKVLDPSAVCGAMLKRKKRLLPKHASNYDRRPDWAKDYTRGEWAAARLRSTGKKHRSRR